METQSEKSHLLYFYGTECPHCERMLVFVKKIEAEKKVKIEIIEIWHNKKNELMMEGYDKEGCGGVPFFYNTKTKAWLCGEVSYKEIEKWVE